MSADTLFQEMSLLDQEELTKFLDLIELWKSTPHLTVDEAQKLFDQLDQNPKRYTQVDIDQLIAQMPQEV